MLDSYLLEYFNAVAEEGTTLKASEKLNVSQPSVTKAIQASSINASLCILA